MSDIIKTVQQQDPGSELITLYDLEYDASTPEFAHFFNGVDDTLNEIKFRDSAGTEITYIALPLEAQGFDISSDGAYSRPEITVANIENVFSQSIGGLDFQSLIGKRITKRTTLRKYLVGESNDSGAGNPPIEFPSVVYIIDRLKSKNIISATFELAAPFDLAGIRLPRRTVIGGACSWEYKGLSRARGGCSWSQRAKDGGTVYLNEFDEYLIPSTTLFNSVGTSITKDSYYSTTTTINRVNEDSTITSVSSNDYWQALQNQGSPVSPPSDIDVFNWRRVRVYESSYSGIVYTYKERKYNTVVLDSGTLWRVNRTHVYGTTGTERKEGIYWTAGDKCGKKVTSCALRYKAITTNSPVGGALARQNSNHLRFGGFPGARQR